ncbi:MAG: hypothetical protein ACHP6J_06185, partial [Burkholderiales bacterium]
HIADAQYIGCSAVAGEKYTPRDIEKNQSAKADIIPALKQAFAYCESAWDATIRISAVHSRVFSAPPNRN